MINFTSILTTIKGMNLAVKIGIGASAVAVVAGGTAGTVTIINANQPKESGIVASNSNTDNSPSTQEDTKPEETKTEDQKAEQTDNEQKPTASNSQATTEKPNSNSSSSSNQSNNNSSTSKPNTSTSQPSQPSQPTQKPDYNLNDRYVAGYATLAFSKQDETGEWYVAEEKQFFGITKFTGSSADLITAVMPQYISYAKAHDYPYGGGMGAISITWEDAIQNGTALNEAKCTQYGLSHRIIHQIYQLPQSSVKFRIRKIHLSTSITFLAILPAKMLARFFNNLLKRHSWKIFNPIAISSP